MKCLSRSKRAAGGVAGFAGKAAGSVAADVAPAPPPTFAAARV
jgi:hypothetical protein